MVLSAMRWSIDLYRKALEFAAFAHRRQKVPGKPYSYVVHLAAVCGEVAAALQVEEHSNPDLAIACALLHDTLEDTCTAPVKVEEAFGRDVYTGVAALTKNKGLSKAASMADSLGRILTEPVEVGMVKMADRSVNLSQPPRKWKRKKVQYYHEEARLILKALRGCSKYMSDRLEKKIEEYAAYL